MPKVDVYNMKGEVVGQIDLSDDIFGVKVNEVAMHSAVVNQLANKRQGTQSTKNVREVRGGGKKPWRQKGTGRARQGSIRNVQWKGGGVAFAPKPRSYSYTIPKKLKRVALKSALSSKVLENNIIVLDDLALADIKTKEFVKVLNNLKVDSSVLVVLPAVDEKVVKSARNVPEVKTAWVNTINTYDILKYQKFIITKDAIARVEEVYA
ncbi:MAG: 50S ribosomal protein L4 [Ruminiclostridium sp.]|nr:50S ribosomal protein L4 [Ruminiclostridium sp.]